MNDLTPTGEVRRMLNGSTRPPHYRITDRLRRDNTRYFTARGDTDMLKCFKSMVTEATPYDVVDVETRGDEFRAEIEHESVNEEADGRGAVNLGSEAAHHADGCTCSFCEGDR